MWFRLILYIIIYVFVGILDAFGSRSRRRWRRRLYGNRYAYNYQDENNDFAENLRAFFRRRRALKKAKSFITKKKKTFTLKNSNVIFIYDSKKKTFVCINANNMKIASSVDWKIQYKYAIEFSNDNTFEQTFDNICLSFDNFSNYEGILKVLKHEFNEVAETSPATDIPHNVITHKSNIEIPKRANRLNINEATEDELAKLPGISLVTAKKIIKRRAKNIFISNEEMFKEMKIKQHFQLNLSKLICANPPKKTSAKTDTPNNIQIDVIENTTQKTSEYRNKDDGDDRVVDF